MAFIFKNEAVTVASGAGASTIYTAPALTQSIIIGFQIANTGTTTATVTVLAASKQLVGTDTPIPTGSALIPISGKLVLEGNDTITVSSTDENVDVIVSMLELS